MNGKGENNSSPVRQSRLKKRLKKRPRPAKESNYGSASTCALQNLTAAAASSKQSRHRRSDNAGAAAAAAANDIDDGRSKENVLNRASSVRFGRSLSGGKGGERQVDERKGADLGTDTLRRAEFAPSSDEDGVEWKSSSNGGRASPCPGIKTADSILSFMDAMDQPFLLSSIPSMLEIDFTLHDAPSSDFQREMEKAFEYRINCRDNDNNRQKYHNSSAENGIYHSLVGRIDPPSHRDVAQHCADDRSIAFPRFGSSSLDATHPVVDDSSQHNIFQHLNLRRETCHGMSIRSSWYQFPMTKKKSRALGNMTHKHCDEADEQPANIDYEEELAENIAAPEFEEIHDNFNDHNQPVQRHIEQQFDRESSSEVASIDGDRNNIQYVKESEAKHCEAKHSTLEIRSPPTPLTYQGKIQIVSNKGATIREVFDIDNSNYVIGKLHEGDTRYFIEKKNLPPPPISLMDDEYSDDESDEECVAVVRYKVVLNRDDCCNSGRLADEASGDMIGWISDRGRLADEPYLILREVS